MKGMITTKEAAQIMGLTPRRIRALVDAGKLKGTKLGRDLFVRESSVHTLMVNRERAAFSGDRGPSTLEVFGPMPAGSAPSWRFEPHSRKKGEAR